MSQRAAMVEERVQRRLAVILAADVVGYGPPVMVPSVAATTID
jgi:ribosome biogenesis protein Tsr3